MPVTSPASQPARTTDEPIGTGTRPRGPEPRTVRVAGIDGVRTEVAIATFPDGEVYRREDARLPAELTSAPWVQWRMSS